MLGGCRDGGMSTRDRFQNKRVARTQVLFPSRPTFVVSKVISLYFARSTDRKAVAFQAIVGCRDDDDDRHDRVDHGTGRALVVSPCSVSLRVRCCTSNGKCVESPGPILAPYLYRDEGSRSKSAATLMAGFRADAAGALHGGPVKPEVAPAVTCHFSS